jgi:RHS repeat-associated protein
LTTDIVFGYTGKYFDETTGLQNSWNRWYSPKMGRFISQDPIGFAAGDANLYRYVGNKPTTHTDPSGLQESANGPSTQSPTITVNVINSGTGQPFTVTLPNPYFQGGQGAYPPILSLPPLLNETERQQLERRMQQSTQDKADWRAAMAEVNQRLQLVTLVGSVLSGKPRRPSNAIVSGSHRPSVTIKPSAPKGPTPPSYSPVGPDGNKLPLPKGPHGQLAPSSEYPHSQIGWYEGRKGGYVQTLEFGPDGKPIKRIDWTDHGRPKEHTNPHCHDYLPNPTGGNHIQGPARPLTPVERGE